MLSEIAGVWLANSDPLLRLLVHSCVLPASAAVRSIKSRVCQRAKPGETVEVYPALADYLGLPARRVLAGKTLC